jgi:hypothetical protein
MHEVTEAGLFELFIGGSSTDEQLKEEFTVTEDIFI